MNKLQCLLQISRKRGGGLSPLWNYSVVHESKRADYSGSPRCSLPSRQEMANLSPPITAIPGKRRRRLPRGLISLFRPPASTSSCPASLWSPILFPCPPLRKTRRRLSLPAPNPGSSSCYQRWSLSLFLLSSSFQQPLLPVFYSVCLPADHLLLLSIVILRVLLSELVDSVF